MATEKTPWERLKEPFDLDEIELLPKPYKKDSPKANCQICGGYHGQPAVHLSYVGHAGITMRLNEVDPDWSWEPMALNDSGTPVMSDGGMWIRLTVLGKTLPAFGDAQGKTGPNATKELIGDAIRNGAMRFGVGTYLWSKSEKAKADLTRQGVEDEPQPEVDTYPTDSQGEIRASATTPASAGQVKAIWAISKSVGWTQEHLYESLATKFGEGAHPDRLTKSQAKAVIDGLKKLEKSLAEKIAEATGGEVTVE